MGLGASFGLWVKAPDREGLLLGLGQVEGGPVMVVGSDMDGKLSRKWWHKLAGKFRVWWRILELNWASQRAQQPSAVMGCSSPTLFYFQSHALSTKTQSTCCLTPETNIQFPGQTNPHPVDHQWPQFTSILAKLIQQYCTLPDPQSIQNYAYSVFKHFDKPNLFLFNTLIRCSQPKESILVFVDWVSRGDLVFDHFTFIFVLGACARSPSVPTLWVGRQTHAQMLKRGTMSNILLQTTAIHFYASNKDVSSARRMFDDMIVRNSITWNVMIKGYCSQKEIAREALVLFRGMLEDDCGVKPTDTTMVCILSTASQLGVLETGACVHGYIEKTIPLPENYVFIGTGLIDMYSKCGCLYLLYVLKMWMSLFVL
ncbi:pentatricopeptide repeat-containing protein At3g18970-like [Ziziphus jujuba]|uniref:Pentatricopeptide repeat-containing protein At3g18970-like n=1 Tax=Ziziphus jujuba TaxID=326968 RepID=A0ABM3IMF8_ZIZJJ|nr:pentatricopeptide repeat-containing protein At3g18970-like [Ziziphus jujuba]